MATHARALPGYISPKCRNNEPDCDDLACICGCHDDKKTNVVSLSDLPPHRRHADAFEDAHMTAAGAIMGARMAGKAIAPWTADMNEAFRAAMAEAFDAGYRFGQETAR